MRKVIISLMFVLMMCSAASASVNTLSDISSHLFITLLNQEPDPAEPGKYVDVRFKIENYGIEPASEVEIEILPSFPFTLVQGEDAVRNLGTIGGRQIGRVGIIEKFRLKVDPEAIEGENEIVVRYKQAYGGWIEWDAFNITVRTQDAILAVEEVKSTPEQIVPGETSQVSMKIVNLADTLLKDIKVTLNLERILAGTVTSYEKFPFAPIGSSNEKVIKQLAGGESKEIVFTLAAEPTADANVYKVPMTITYIDNIGTNYSRTNLIGLIVGGQPDLVVTLEDSEVKKAKQSGTVSIKIVNKGVADAKFVYIKLAELDKYDIIGVDATYVGNIDSDDYETADFEIYLKSSDGSVNLPIVLEYRDATNKLYTENIQVPLSVYSKSELKKYGLEEKSGSGGIIIFVVIVVAGLIIYWRWKKKKNKQKKQ